MKVSELRKLLKGVPGDAEVVTIVDRDYIPEEVDSIQFGFTDAELSDDYFELVLDTVYT